MKIFKRVLKILLAVAAVFVLAVVGYLIYLLVDYERIEDKQELAINNNTDAYVTTETDYEIITYNIGFAAYTPEFSFFMDGGTESRAFSKQSVLDTMNGISKLLKEEDADFVMLEEVDKKSTRSYHVDERGILIDELGSAYNSVYAVNYDSSYLFYPFDEPHGKSLSGLLTFSKYTIESSVRRSLPIETSLMKYVDLDRCYSVSRVPVDNGKELILYTVHLSAYTSDGTIATEQLKMLIADMTEEYNKGNYIVCGGDFNKDLLGDSSKYFGVSGEEFTWAQPFPFELLNNTPFTVCAALDEKNPLPTCRDTEKPIFDGQFVLSVDGFIVSDNVSVSGCQVVNGDFIYSDHNPVSMIFRLEP